MYVVQRQALVHLILHMPHIMYIHGHVCTPIHVCLCVHGIFCEYQPLEFSTCCMQYLGRSEICSGTYTSMYIIKYFMSHTLLKLLLA